MKSLKYLSLIFVALFMFSCSEDIMDDINKEQNDALEMDAKNILPDAIVKTAYETTGTDIAWYATVYIEHNAGTWGQSYEADVRAGQNASSLFNNSWNSLYDVMNICQTMLNKTDPNTGLEGDNYWVRGVAQVLMAYNLAVATDMWGEVPFTEAFKGIENMKPKYENQSDIYVKIQALLDDAIVNLGKANRHYPDKDLIFGPNSLAASKSAWTKVAYSLKARYAMRLSQRDAAAATKALTAIANGFTSAADQFLFDKYVDDLPNGNPWCEFWYVRNHLCVSQTFYDILNVRNDPRIDAFLWKVDGTYKPAPSGASIQTQGGIYSQSQLSTSYNISWDAPTPLMSYHELKFIEAEAQFRTGNASWTATLRDAISAAFDYHGVAGANAYFTANVQPRLTAGNELNEIMTQKYIAMFEAEAIEAYNDYRRTGIPTMRNPHNAIEGFVNRFPYALSETSSNSANVPTVDALKDKVWWAGGTELMK